MLTGLAADWTQAQNSVDVPTVDAWIRKQAEDAPLSMQFRGSTAEQCRRWQAQFSAKLRSLLGPHTPPARWQTVVERRTDLDDHRREELVLIAEGHPPLPLYLLTPRKKANGRRAGILAIHGHGPHGHHPVVGREDLPGVANAIKNSHYDYGRILVRRGYVVAVPCLTPFGRRLGGVEVYGKQDPCAITFLRLQMLGKLLIAENLRDCLWALEALARHEQVDARRLGCVGLSYGGRMTMLTAALEPRIRVAVVSGALNMMQERIAQPYSCGAQIIPGLLAFGDVPEIASLIAPRPCVWEVGSRDTLIAPRQAQEALTRIRRVYKAPGAEEQLSVDRFEGGHEWSGRLAYPLLEKVLR
ncbi:MAG: prolyl oligopeptidase family serine peptidase [Planctomycetes bacterium]|nr:prolyl oligopeptidase family serine peptidase [Planctomycetota bacterium]